MVSLQVWPLGASWRPPLHPCKLQSSSEGFLLGPQGGSELGPPNHHCAGGKKETRGLSHCKIRNPCG